MPTKILHVPYYSQFHDITREEWRSHTCGVVCVAMTLAFAKGNRENHIEIEDYANQLDNFVDEVVFVKGQMDGKWTHNALALLARNHGLPAYPQEFRTVEINMLDKSCKESRYAADFKKNGLLKILKTVKNGMPVLVSVEKGFATNKSSHNILIVGYETRAEDKKKDQLDTVTHLYVHDPDTREYEKKNMKVEITKFLEYWRLYAIFFESVSRKF